jgi:Skp family chaperone for outer membrane proteins
MKRIFKPILFSVCLGIAAGAMASGETVFVNLDALYRNFYKTKLMYTELRARETRINEDHDVLLKEFEAMNEKYAQLRAESLDTALDEEILLSKRTEAEELLIDLQNKDRALREVKERQTNQLQQDKSGMDKRILEQVRDAIKMEAQTKGYLVVHNIQNVGASELQSVLTTPYYDPSAEITQDVLARLNKGYVEDETAETETEGAE